MKKVMMSMVVTAILTGPAVAQEAVTFTPAESGTPATAAEINANFQALAGAINDLAPRVAALENNEADDVAGKTYKLQVFELEFIALKYGADPTANIPEAGSTAPQASNGYSLVNTQNTLVTLTFIDDFNATLETSESTVALQGHSVANVGPLAGESATPVTAGPSAITYTQNEGLVTLQIPDDEGGPDELLELFVSRDGQSIQAMQPMQVDEINCFDETAGVDLTGDGTADPGCNVEWEMQTIHGIESTPAN